MVSRDLLRRFYPDSRPDNTQLFYSWVRQNISPQTVLLNLGAGKATGTPLRRFRGEVALVVGADIDPAVLDNEELDGSYIIREGRLPFGDESFDVIVSDFVFEHVLEPLPFLMEARRVLRANGSYFFRTPNRYHYVALMAAATPLWFHRMVANRARGLDPSAVDQHPTRYLMNSRKALNRLALDAGFRSPEIILVEAHPAYLLFNTIPFLAGVAYERVVNRVEWLAGIRASILGRFLR